MDLQELLTRIVELKLALSTLVGTSGSLTTPEVIAKSWELDQLVSEYYRRTREMSPPAKTI